MHPAYPEWDSAWFLHTPQACASATASSALTRCLFLDSWSRELRTHTWYIVQAAKRIGAMTANTKARIGYRNQLLPSGWASDDRPDVIRRGTDACLISHRRYSTTPLLRFWPTVALISRLQSAHII
jgi:hypothetical protein